MAGFYPDVPGPRIPYDSDGTVVMRWAPSVLAPEVISSAQFNTETVGSGGTSFFSDVAANHVIWLFPHLVDLIGFWAQFRQGGSNRPSPTAISTSNDTTNGVDGTWVQRMGAWPYTPDSGSRESMRTSITPLAVSGVKAVRFSTNGPSLGSQSALRRIHLYGRPSAGENLDRLHLWHPILDQEIGGSYFDWADILQSSSADRTFRVKNGSQLLRAVAPTVSVEALTDPSPSVAAQHLLSTDGVNFNATAALGSLEPQAISDAITLRRATPSNAVLSIWSPRVIASATSWEVV